MTINMKIHSSIVILISLILSACATSPSSDKKVGAYSVQPYEVLATPMTSETTEEYLSASDVIVPSKDLPEPGLSAVLKKEDLSSTPPLKPSPFGEIPLTINKYVQKWINFYTGNGRSHMQRYLSRSSRYLPTMKKILAQEGLPEDLVYLPVIESGFQSKVNSHAGASGYWQFMKGSAKDYGLTVGRHVDERHDFVRSTEAAATYLKRLYTLFGDWYLALAAYNTGENRVKSQLMKAETRNYWVLVKRKKLYRETRNYVPKFIAATLIAKNPVLYGFTNIPYQKEVAYESMYVHRPVSLQKLAKKIGTPLKKLKKLNPRYRTHYVPIYRGKSSLVRVPPGKLALAQRSLASIQAKRPRVYSSAKTFTHKVRRGENLSLIAKKHGVSVGQLRRSNSLSRRSILRVGQRLKVVKGKSYSTTRRASRSLAKAKYRPSFHRVKKGENLSVIAKKYGMTLGQLLSLNSMGKNKTLRVGQKLSLKSSRARSSHLAKVKKYKVKKGDNLQKISKAYGLSVSKIKKVNKLKSNKIMVGQSLKLMGVDLKVHIVKRGENLIGIANKYKVSLSRLLNINNIKNKSTLHIGRKIKVPVAMN